MEELKAKRRDYIARLIAGVRKEIDNHMVDVDGDKGYPSEWIDAALLCDVVEKEVLNTRADGFEELQK